jgi:transcriptional regulator
MGLGHTDLLRGTLDMLALKALSVGPIHGWGLALRIGQLSRDALAVNQGSLYPALQGLKRRGWVKAEWRTSANNRKAVYYSITKSGLRHLEKEEARWREATAAVNSVLTLAITEG